MTEIRSNALNIAVARDETTAIVRLMGELDLATAPILDAALQDLEAPCERVVLDLSRLTFIDSTGLRLVFSAHRRAVSDGFDLVLAGANGHVLEILHLTALNVTLPMAPDVASSLGNGTPT
jgi:anti-sigma B factor antagonist